MTLAGGAAQLLFPDGQRAQAAQPGLEHDDGNREQMSQPEPEVSDPGPISPPADQDQRLTADDKTDDKRMDDQNQIGKHARMRDGIVDVTNH